MNIDESVKLLDYKSEARKGKLKWVMNIKIFLLILNTLIFFIFDKLDIIPPNPAIHYIQALLAIYIIVTIIILKEINNLSKYKVNKNYISLFALFIVTIDFLVYFIFIYLTGGITSPFIIMLILIIILNSFILDAYHVFIFAIASIIFLILLMVGEYNGIIYHYKSFWEDFIHFDISHNYSLMSATFLLYSSLIITISYISYYINRNIQEQTDKIQEAYKKTFYVSITDRLTGLYDQIYFRELLQKEIDLCIESKGVFSIIFLDVDHFKNYNDLNGHLMGSKTLQEVANVMRNNFRHDDILCKFGGDEFVIIAKKLDKKSAVKAAERLRKAIINYNFKNAEYQPEGRITISLGVATFPYDGNMVKELLTKADTAMYMAKAMGRNRTIEWKTQNT
ncbi:MAG: diguanylate cyclase [Proteobacteria bacterium]|nr:diguanylate cyclase [Pseudomonadota bacterium]